MDALDLINLRYDAVHGGFVDDLFSGLSDEQVRQRPGGVNSIAWLVWHLARVQDAAVSRFVDDRPQVLEEGRWNEAMRLDRRDVGSGMTSQEVDALSAAIDITALRGYHRAVAERTKVIATSLSPAAWNEVVPADRIHQVVAKESLLRRRGPVGRGVLGSSALARLVSAAGGTAPPVRPLLRRDGHARAPRGARALTSPGAPAPVDQLASCRCIAAQTAGVGITAPPARARPRCGSDRRDRRRPRAMRPG